MKNKMYDIYAYALFENNKNDETLKIFNDFYNSYFDNDECTNECKIKNAYEMYCCIALLYIANCCENDININNDIMTYFATNISNNSQNNYDDVLKQLYEIYNNDYCCDDFDYDYDVCNHKNIFN